MIIPTIYWRIFFEMYQGPLLLTEINERAVYLGYLYVNPLRAKFFRGNINIYLHFVSFLHIDTTQVVEILPQVRQESAYST